MQKFDIRKWEGFKKASSNDITIDFIDDIVIDSRRVATTNTMFVALEGETYDGHDFVTDAAQAGAQCAIVRQGYTTPKSSPPITLFHVEDTLKAFQDIAAAYRKNLPTQFIAITGSQGKTLVKDLLTALLATTKNVAASPESFNSQIGVPLSILRVTRDHAVAIIEAGISQPGEMDSLATMIAPTCGIITIIGDEHIASLGTKKTIAEEKMKLFDNISQDGWVLAPDDDNITENHRQQRHHWNVADGNLPHAIMLTKKHEPVMKYQMVFPDGTSFRGCVTGHYKFFLDIVNIASKAAWLLGVPTKKICKVLKKYSPEVMQAEIWKTSSGTTVINEPYGSDVLSMQLALTYFDDTPAGGKKIFVFGGMRQNDNNTIVEGKLLGKAIADANVDRLFVVGDKDFTLLIENVKKCSPKTAVEAFATQGDAFNALEGLTKQNDIVVIKGHKKIDVVDVRKNIAKMFADNTLKVDLGNIKDNIENIRSGLPKDMRIMMMVKAMGYGTENTILTRFLQKNNIDIVGVAFADEGIMLRKGGVTANVFVINVAQYDVSKIIEWEFESGISDIETIHALNSAAKKKNKTMKVHLNIDTGMSRFGCRAEDAITLAEAIDDAENLKLEGLMTHYAFADDTSRDEETIHQTKAFKKIIKKCSDKGITPAWIHSANSSAAIRFDTTHTNMVRIGLAAYGMYPSEACKDKITLKLSLSLTSKIARIQTCYKGETVSYGGSYTVQHKEERIAVIPLGYFDGIHRRYSGKGYALVRGQKAPFVGAICMDFMMLDVTNIDNVTVGDSVLIFGEDEYGNTFPVEDLAYSGGSIPYELITCLGPRIQRVFTYSR